MPPSLYARNAPGCTVYNCRSLGTYTVPEIVNVNREISKLKVDFKGNLEYRINLSSLNAPS